MRSKIDNIRYKSALLLGMLIFIGVASIAQADVLFFSGDLRSNATFTDCGVSCTLGPGNPDGDYAQFAAVTYQFTVTTATDIQAITYSYAGGTSLTGAVVPSGGLEPYLSLFDGSGNFITSTFSSGCPPGGNTLGGNCFDVLLDTGSLMQPGTYTIALSAFENMSRAENTGTGTLADGFTGLGNLAAGESLAYAFDVNLPTNTPEPSSGLLVLVAGGAAFFVNFRKRRQLQKENSYSQ